MKTFWVSLMVESSSLSLHELSLKLGRPHSSGSHTKGERDAGRERIGRPPWSKTGWRFDSSVSETASVGEHLENLRVQFPPDELLRLLPAECTVYVDIAVFFDTANVSANISRADIEIIDAYNAALEVTCYPTRFKEEREQ